jgi:hypothetical protein
MNAERPDANERGRVVAWRPKHPAAGNDNRPSPPIDTPSGIGDLGQFEHDGTDDYRHRMTMNAVAFIVCIVLVLAGIWLATKLAQVQKDQDCVLSGRRGCTPVDVPVRSRW